MEMQTETKREHYLRRMRYCADQAMVDKSSNYYWQQAVETYQHLLVCDKSHTVHSNGKEKCEWKGDAQNHKIGSI
jgi:hypothetical protein